MAYHEHSQVILEELEPRDYFETFAIAIPIPGSAPIITHSGDEDYEHVLATITANKYVNDQAINISKRSAEIIAALRGLAHILQREENRCEDTNIHIYNIARLVEIAERDADIGYKVSRIQLLKFDFEQHLRAETQLAVAERELAWIKEDLKESIDDMNKLDKLKRAINDCIRAGHEKLGNLALF